MMRILIPALKSSNISRNIDGKPWYFSAAERSAALFYLYTFSPCAIISRIVPCPFLGAKVQKEVNRREQI